VRVLDGASKYQRYLQQTTIPQTPTDDRHTLSMTDWNGDGRLDLAVVQTRGTASSWVEARILAG
jgi:hypothetical protein